MNVNQSLSSTAKTSPATNKTAPTTVDPREFIGTANTSKVRREDALTLLELMQDTTGQRPTMWGPSMVGFGQYHYSYTSGRQGDAAAVAFSPRKAALVIYGLTYPPAAAPLLEQLGKFKSGVDCVYINKLADVDMAVLRELIAMTYQHCINIQSPPPQQE